VNTTCEPKTEFAELTDYISGVLDPEHPQGSLIAILHFAQERLGYLSKEVMDHISKVTEIPTAEIYGVATFYSYFKHQPQGKHHISLCMGTACYIRGAQKVLDAIQDVLDIGPGETTEDMLFTLDETRCIGACGLAPVMVVGEKVFGRVTPDQVKDILNAYRSSP
jgi:NADH-quinone oxidoreductase subunit E/NADP-reducing hydrogenase subunit HndA